MAFSRILVSALALSLPVATVVARSLTQHVAARSSLDICATIDESSLSTVGLYLPGSYYLPCVDICMCISTLPAAIQGNNDLRTLAGRYGESRVENDLRKLVDYAMNRESCSYPDYSTPACTPQNPCAFDCEPPFVAKGNQCVCQAPYKLCNGVCGSFAYGCGSAAPQPHKRLTPEMKARSHGIYTNEDAQSTCRRDETVCGVYDGSNAFECLNTDISLESCGGCMSPNPFLYESEQGPEGVDCTAIPHVLDVRCSRGRCSIHRCEEGFFPSADRSECVCEHDIAPAGQRKMQAVPAVSQWGF